MATADEIRKFAASKGFNPNAQGRYDVNDDNSAYRIYGQAASQGYSGADLDEAFGWDAGSADKWATGQGLQLLKRPQAMPATAAPPAPAAPTPAPAPGASTTSIMERATGTAGRLVGAPPAPAAAAAPAYQASGLRQGQAAQTQWDESMSTEGRLAGIMRRDSPLMQLAQTRGAQAANRRGLGASSMAAEAAQKAMIESAAPIAANDASLFNAAARANTEQSNAWDMRDLEREQADRQFGAKLASDESQFSRNLAEQGRQANLGATTQLSIAGMNYDIQDRRLTQEDQQFLKQYQLETRKLDTAIDQFAKQFGLSVDQLELDKSKLSQQDRQYYDGLKLERDKLTQQGEQFQTEWENRFSLGKLAASNRIDLANIDATNRKDLMGLEATYKKEIASNETISNAWGTMMQEVGRIQNNPDLDEAAKKTLINNAISSFGSFTSFWKKVSGGTVDVSDLLNFGIAGDSAPSGAAGGTAAAGGAAPQNADTSVIPGGGGGP